MLDCSQGILSGRRILQEMKAGHIEITPFDEKQLNPNSYNLRLADEILVYEPDNYRYGPFDPPVLDMARDNPCRIEKIPKDGYLLSPGTLYLARTVEKTRTDGFLPMLEGRSSVGRLGLFIHATAGFGDNGFNGYWTLELSCVQPLIIYPFVEIGQIYYHTIAQCDDGYGCENQMMTYKNGKYQNNNGIQKSMLWKEFQKCASD